MFPPPSPAVCGPHTLAWLADLAEAITASAFDGVAIAQTVVVRVQQALGHCCTVHIADPSGERLELRALAHRDPEAAEALTALLTAHPLDLRAGWAQVVCRQRAAIRIEAPDPVQYLDQVPPEYRTAAAAQAPSTVLVAPVAAGDQVLGGITVARYDRTRFTEEDELLLTDIAHLTALALLRAREHQALRAERRRLEAVLEQMPVAVTLTESPSGRVLLWNRLAEEVLGLPVPLRTLLAFDPRTLDDRPIPPAALPCVRAITEGPPVRDEHVRVTLPAGRQAVFRVQAGPIRDEHGQIIAGVVAFDDVSERIRADAQLNLLARLGQTFARTTDWDQTVDGVIDLVLPALADFGFFDVIEEGDEPRVGRVRRVARAPGDAHVQTLLEQSRWSPSPPGGRNLCALTTGISGLEPHVDDAWLREVAQSPEHLAFMRELAFVSMMTVPLVDGQRVLGALTLFVTDRRRAYTERDLAFAELVANRVATVVHNARLVRELSSALHAAQQAERRKDEFLAMLGHELRNPMAPILTALTLMRRQTPDIHRRERDVIERQTRHLVRLVDDLLDVARIAQGKLDLRRGRVDLGEIVTRAAETVAPLFEQRRHQLALQLAPALPVDGDPERLHQVFANLLTNAARYTPPGGEVRVDGRIIGNEVVATVSDTGVGLAADRLAQIFEMFVQGERSLDRADGGLGLGLAIVRSLVELHGGSVCAESEGPGKGARFVVRLPVVDVGLWRAVDPEAPLRDGVNPRVLIVDDNQDAAELLADALAAYGCDVRVAFDPISALDQAETFVPEVAILDIGLPVMDGYELGRRLHEQAGTHPPALVALTGYGQAGDRARSARHGFAAHLVKPVDVDELRKVVCGFGA